MEQLPWLPQHPDLSAAIGMAKRETEPLVRLEQAAKLAGYRRDFTATGRLDKLSISGLEQLAETGDFAAHRFTPLRMALLSSHTVDHLVPSIRVAGLGRRLALSVYVGPYGMYRQALLTEDPVLTAFAPQVILLALDANDAPLNLPVDTGEEEVEEAVRTRVDELRLLWRRAKERYAAKVIQQTLVPSEPALFGSFEALVPAAPHSVIERLNAAIRTAARQEGVLLLDLAALAAQGSYGQGLAEPVRWHQAKQLVSPTLAPLYGDHLARILAARVGLSRKCLVLDLDNTLWGGVIGDDGLEGIKLGQGSPSGEAFLAFQRYVVRLAERGVILAVCSKNDMAVAEAAFEHPEMLIKRSSIAAFVANWEDKAGNLRRIASMIDIGLDSLVFVDDNPAERDIVRRELPEVGVPELPEDVADYAARVAAAGYFESASFTTDDATRGQNYALNAQRKAALGQATDMEGYLRGLEMVLTATRIGTAELTRSTQLINKTNQFNLTTRRYGEAEVERLAEDPRAIALAIRLKDKFGDNGLISVVLARPDSCLAPKELYIDTWLMSCRVLGRQVEQAVLDVLITTATNAGYHALIGEYRPTSRNAMVAEHYPKLGFVSKAAPEEHIPDAQFWHYDMTTPRNVPTHFIEVTHA
ncbi:methoxymalonyl-ACP biosynthesis protein [Pseudomonas luteola]|uniref:Methoxymalonyl-ACP biosynthesis protein n=1 Tax=Pseudomonas luteola TaxID=47886 RepID=A0A2X2C586_PSELU|nr:MULTISPECIES: HAD-IIIC family phosphatase [Pseudomonas]SPZ02488.1 methoxymalonyl-ACP biosynthesis protein [Pseudomonas luteola]